MASARDPAESPSTPSSGASSTPVDQDQDQAQTSTPAVEPAPQPAPVVAAPKNHTPPYYGRKELSLLCERTVKSFFPLPSGLIPTSPEPERPARNLAMSGWIAYILYRTALPDTTVFHALHLLRRLAGQSRGFPDFEHEFLQRDSNLYHRALMICAFILATNYHMDDSFALSSWSIATKTLFTTPELSTLTLSLLSSLGYLLRQHNEDLNDILLGYKRDWEASIAKRVVGDEVHARASAREREQAAAPASAPSKEPSPTPTPHTPAQAPLQLRQQASAKSLRRAQSLGRALGAALLRHQSSSPTASNRMDEDVPPLPRSAPPLPKLVGHGIAHASAAVRVVSR